MDGDKLHNYGPAGTAEIGIKEKLALLNNKLNALNAVACEILSVVAIPRPISSSGSGEPVKESHECIESLVDGLKNHVICLECTMGAIRDRL